MNAADVCDGSSLVRFHYEHRADRSALTEGSALLFENGSAFLLVSGSCEYWIAPGVGSFDDYRTGVLSDVQMVQLVEGTRMGQWQSMNGQVWRGTAIGSGLLMFSDGSHWLGVSSFQQEGDVPELVRALWMWRSNSQSELWAAARPVSGPVRYRVFRRESDSAVPTTVWPLSVPLEEVAEDAYALAENTFGAGRLVVDAAEVAKLRDLRRRYFTERPFGFPDAYGYLPIGDGSISIPTHWLYVRDTVPFEDESGLLPRPWAAAGE